MDKLVRQYSNAQMFYSRLMAVMLMLLGLTIGSTAIAEQPIININTATSSQLSEGLIGVGERKSIAIVKNREALGVFAFPVDITRVKGIGEAIFIKNKSRIVVK